MPESAIDPNQIERTLQLEAATEAVAKADQAGWLELNDYGSFLHTRESIQADQAEWHDEDDCKNFDFSSAPYWITGFGEPTAIFNADDYDLLCQIEIDEDELETAIQIAVSEQRRKALGGVAQASRSQDSDLADVDEVQAHQSRGRRM